MKTIALFTLAFVLPCSSFADVNSGMVAFYSFDGSGNNSAGSGLNMTGQSMSYQTGLFGQAAAFNGSSSYFATADPFPITGATSRTVDVWLYANSYWGNRNVLNWGNYVDAGGSWTIMLQEPQVGQALASAHWLIFGSDSHPNSYGTGSWFNLAVTFDGTSRSARFYLNGIDIGGGMTYGNEEGLAAMYTASAPLTVGNIDLTRTPYSNPWYAPWDGLMDNLRIYDRVLTTEEIAQLAVVPEPSALTFWLSATAALAIFRRTRRSAGN